MLRLKKFVGRFFVGAVAATMAATSLAAVPAGATGFSCREVTRNVALGPGLPADQTIKGILCEPGGYDGVRSLDILVHGATYDRTYWDFPVDQPQYSYVKRTQLAGRATFAYDRLGAGQSSHPLSAILTVESDAFVLHQLIGWARSGLNFQKVNLVGHSFGSIVSINETATYNDADKLVVTGALHAAAPGQETAFASLYPAFLDPQFAGAGLDPGYITTIPGTRDDLFYSDIAEPEVIAYDEAHKDVISGSQFGQGIGQFLAPAPANVSQGIQIPVMVVVGDQDLLFCVDGTINCESELAVYLNEAPYYPNAESLRVASINDTGHDLTLHPTAGISFLRINFWIKNI